MPALCIAAQYSPRTLDPWEQSPIGVLEIIIQHSKEHPDFYIICSPGELKTGEISALVFSELVCSESYYLFHCFSNWVWGPPGVYKSSPGGPL